LVGYQGSHGTDGKAIEPDSENGPKLKNSVVPLGRRNDRKRHKPFFWVPLLFSLGTECSCEEIPSFFLGILTGGAWVTRTTFLEAWVQGKQVLGLWLLWGRGPSCTKVQTVTDSSHL
jgi:hypothetical protein